MDNDQTFSTSRFGVIVLPDAPLAILVERFRRVEQLGFHQLFLPDHVVSPFGPEPPWLDGWTLTAAAAVQTERIRVGTLVSNPILRPPAVLAREAVTVDHLSGGRLDLGIGAGVVEGDHHATGSEPWSVKERVGRFAEYVEILDGILQGDGRPYSFDGRWYRATDVPTVPGPVQSPRPQLIVGGQAPTVLRVAADHGDVWNTHTAYGAGVAVDATLDDVVERTRQQNRRLDELCEERGRDPKTLRRSGLLTAATTELVERFGEAGIEDFVFGWPPDEHLDEFEQFAQTLTSG